MHRLFLIHQRTRPLTLLLVILMNTALLYGQSPALNRKATSTIINPINLSYRFCLDTPSRREAADPTMVNFKGEYYLFASKSGGYFHSTDLKNWQLITTKDLPLEDYAPTAVAIGDTLYFMAGANNPVIYKSGDPKSGKWSVANTGLPLNLVADPCLFLDEDGRLFLYFGCSDVQPIYGVELDKKTFNPLGKPTALLKSDTTNYGWERKGDHNELPGSPWIEGSWMTKHKGKYYLQYAGPGTEFKSYSDGVYVSKSPLGPFKLGADNPFSSKPEGFIAGAGHGSTFKDNYGNYWHIATMTISQKHMFERRLGLFPTFFDKDGVMTTYTGFGDFPYYLPTFRFTDPRELFANWMLLSYKKQVNVSSSLPGHEAALATDENIRTYWSAKTGGPDEWIQIDLKNLCTVNAVQLNFAENNTDAFGRAPGLRFQYNLQYSEDGKVWHEMIDKADNNMDLSHDYINLTRPVKARFIKLSNKDVPSGTFALSDLRVFGNRNASTPKEVDGLQVRRSKDDRVQVILSWKENNDAVGYNIRYGTDPSKLYHNYQVLGGHGVTIRSLSALRSYYFTVDAFNESGVTRGKAVIKVQ
ncbi:MAG TPA: family 43 glycosylhydrolase [Arachidicoccus sp.]|nr:family 43 glycosylhydrolase [Arachidicoccus sp.]